MLCQLVCVDRRYQRMNCFNIRELQGILKRKFFTDLVNSNDHRNLFDKSIIGLRFKNNGQLNINHDMSLFYNFGTTTTAKAKYSTFTNNYLFSTSPSTNYHVNDLFIKLSELLVYITNKILTAHIFDLSKFFTPSNNSFNSFTSNIGFQFSGLVSLVSSFTLMSLTSLQTLPKLLQDFLVMNTLVSFYTAIQTKSSFETISTDLRTNYSSENISNLDSLQTTNSSMSEISTTLRFTRFNNPLISYDYKCGNYLGI
jgi:hypothetical protein